MQSMDPKYAHPHSASVSFTKVKVQVSFVRKISRGCFTRRLNPLAAGLNLNPAMKADASNKEIEEAMKRVREAQSLISAAIEPGSECSVFGDFVDIFLL